jgi:hypothetical protein
MRIESWRTPNEQIRKYLARSFRQILAHELLTWKIHRNLGKSGGNWDNRKHARSFSPAVRIVYMISPPDLMIISYPFVSMSILFEILSLQLHLVPPMTSWDMVRSNGRNIWSIRSTFHKFIPAKRWLTWKSAAIDRGHPQTKCTVGHWPDLQLSVRIHSDCLTTPECRGVYQWLELSTARQWRHFFALVLEAISRCGSGPLRVTVMNTTRDNAVIKGAESHPVVWSVKEGS